MIKTVYQLVIKIQNNLKITLEYNNAKCYYQLNTGGEIKSSCIYVCVCVCVCECVSNKYAINVQ